jgi:curved DNA-binding protein CbpA
VTGWSEHQQPDLYGVLGLDRTASRADIIRAYRQQARAVHPDARPHDPDAAARFRALTDAYDVLSDPARRDAYDRRRPAPPPARPGAPEPGARHRAARRPPGGLAGAGGAPLWAGPVHVDPPAADAPADRAGPPGRPAAGGRAGPRDAAAALLADMIDRYFGGYFGGTGWSGDEQEWPI